MNLREAIDLVEIKVRASKAWLVFGYAEMEPPYFYGVYFTEELATARVERLRTVAPGEEPEGYDEEFIITPVDFDTDVSIQIG